MPFHQIVLGTGSLAGMLRSLLACSVAFRVLLGPALAFKVFLFDGPLFSDRLMALASWLAGVLRLPLGSPLPSWLQYWQLVSLATIRNACSMMMEASGP